MFTNDSKIMRARLKAFALHLFCSSVVIASFLAVVFFIWYPEPFSEIYHTWDAIKIIVAVDVVLGPLCTLIIFDIRKKIKLIKLDMLVIVSLQVIALSWGMYVTYSVRPVFIVYYDGEFVSFAESDLKISALEDKSLVPALWKPPRMVYIKPPKDGVEHGEIILNQLVGTVYSMPYLTSRYLPIENMNKEDLIKRAMDINSKYRHPDIKKYVNNFVLHHGGKVSDYAFYPVKGGTSAGTLVLNSNSGKITGYIDKFLEY